MTTITEDTANDYIDNHPNFGKIEQALFDHYDDLGQGEDYYNDEEVGKFIYYCMEEEYDDDSPNFIKDEFPDPNQEFSSPNPDKFHERLLDNAFVDALYEEIAMPLKNRKKLTEKQARYEIYLILYRSIFPEWKLTNNKNIKNIKISMNENKSNVNQPNTPLFISNSKTINKPMNARKSNIDPSFKNVFYFHAYLVCTCVHLCVQQWT